MNFPNKRNLTSISIFFSWFDFIDLNTKLDEKYLSSVRNKKNFYASLSVLIIFTQSFNDSYLIRIKIRLHR